MRAHDSATEPREVYLRADIEALADVLSPTGDRANAIAEATRLINEAGGLLALGQWPMAALRRAGLRPAQVIRLQAAFRLGQRAMTRRDVDTSLVDARDVYHRVWPRLAGLQQEVFIAVAIDIRNVVIAEIEIARGSLTQVEVHPREVFRPLIQVGAVGVIAVHNHPSGDPTPSPDDLALTRRLREVGLLIGIPLVDHVIVAEGGCRSMAEWLATGAGD